MCLPTRRFELVVHLVFLLELGFLIAHSAC
jgi:hypothetical protein